MLPQTSLAVRPLSLGLSLGLAVISCRAVRYHLFHFWQNVFNDDIQVLDVAQQGECLKAQRAESVQSV